MTSRVSELVTLKYTKDAKALREFEKMNGDAMRIVGNAFLWFVGLPFERFPDGSLQNYFFEALQRGCVYNNNKRKAGIKGGVKSGKVREYRDYCRTLVFNGIEDIRGALSSGDFEIAIQAALEYCHRRPDLKFENALRKRAKIIGAGVFSELCDRVITTEKEPNERSNAVIGILDNAVEAKAAQEVGGSDVEPNEVGA